MYGKQAIAIDEQRYQLLVQYLYSINLTSTGGKEISIPKPR